MIFALLLVTATFRPAAPTVGDPIVIEFQQPVALDPSPDYEIIAQSGTRAVIRSFQPRPFPISGRVGDVRFRSMTVPMRSVLRPDDTLQPSPLKPPRRVPYPRAPFVAIGAAAVAAVVAWAAAFLLARRAGKRAETRPKLSPAEQFRTTVADLRTRRSAGRLAALADATRVFLASLSPHLGVELTTSQLLPRLDAQAAPVVARILTVGDLQKFSPWGAPATDFDALAESALALIPPPVQEEAAA